MRSALLLALCTGASAQQYAAVAANAACTNGVGCKGYYRAFVATTLPANSNFGPPSNVTGIALAAIGVQAQTDGTVTDGRVDVAGLKFRTPADTSDTNPDLSFYFGYLGVGGVWDNNTRTGAVNGALCEIYSSMNSIQIYYDRDQTPGFQWDLSGKDIFDCTKTWDCVDPAGTILMTNLTWTPITRVVDACMDKLPATAAGYDANCKIFTLRTSGTLNGTAVVTIEIRTVSQPLMIDGMLHTPDKAKWDVRVNYPWAAVTLATPASAKVAIVNVHAGKAATAAGVVTVNSGTVSKSLTFTAAGGKSAYFGYSTDVTIDTVASKVVTQTITAEDVKNWNSAVLTPTTGLMIKLKFAVGLYELFGGWRAQLTVHSFTPVVPNNIFWDPENGVGSTGGAMVAVPSLFVLILALLY